MPEGNYQLLYELAFEQADSIGDIKYKVACPIDLDPLRSGQAD